MDLPPGLTRHAHYAALPPAPTRPGGHCWSRETALVALTLFLAEEGHPPKYSALNAREGLPNFLTVQTLFGSLRAYLASVAEAPAPPTYAKEVACPRCQRRWCSPDARYERFCRRCREKPPAEEGLWLTGAACIEGSAIDDLWEEDV